MGKFVFVETGMEGLYEIEPTVYGDGRGYFLETYNERDFEEAGITERFAQDNQSLSVKGVLRGLHYQKKHPQGKLVRVLSGEVFDVAVDMRAGSATYGRWHGVTLSGGNKRQFYVPKGFAHGFLVLSEEAVFAYKCTEFYHPEDEGGILWSDGAIGIAWPDIGREYLLSEKDKKWPGLEETPRAGGEAFGFA
jgi:dTDP-4-dehydrorhamnose 3,5-epimerase